MLYMTGKTDDQKGKIRIANVCSKEEEISN